MITRISPEKYFSSVRVFETGNNPQQRSLATPGGPQHNQHLTFADIKIDAPQNSLTSLASTTELFAEVADANDRVWWSGSCCRRFEKWGHCFWYCHMACSFLRKWRLFILLGRFTARQLRGDLRHSPGRHWHEATWCVFQLPAKSSPHSLLPFQRRFLLLPQDVMALRKDQRRR